MQSTYIPAVDKCCGCVTDLKTATAIIAVLGVVTSPAVSWAVVRHSFVIRVSCYITTSAVRADVVDINLNNMLSFGFGANAGLGPSCLSPKNYTIVQDNTTTAHSSSYVNLVRWIGWAVLLADFIVIGFSLHFLYRLFRPPDKKPAIRFMVSCAIAIMLSFIYGMLYVGACISVGGSFPVFEFLFCIIDVLTYGTWVYLLQFVWYHLKSQEAVSPPPLSRIQQLQETLHLYNPTRLWEQYKGKKENLSLGTLILSNWYFLLHFSVGLLFNSS